VGNDRLYGLGGGRDALFGGDGVDLLMTGNGSIHNIDTLDGGAGSDVIALLTSGGSFGQRATVNGFTPGVDVWIVNADAVARHVHTSASTPDFARVVQSGANVLIGSIATLTNATRADVIAAFGGVHNNPDAYWLLRLGSAGAGVSADRGGATAGLSSGDAHAPDGTSDGASDGHGVLDGGGVWDGSGPGTGHGPPGMGTGNTPFDRTEALDMEAQAEADLLARLGGAGTTEFLFDDPTAAWVDLGVLDVV